jgi:hypothetical protein
MLIMKILLIMDFDIFEFYSKFIGTALIITKIGFLLNYMKTKPKLMHIEFKIH